MGSSNKKRRPRDADRRADTAGGASWIPADVAGCAAPPASSKSKKYAGSPDEGSEQSDAYDDSDEDSEIENKGPRYASARKSASGKKRATAGAESSTWGFFGRATGSSVTDGQTTSRRKQRAGSEADDTMIVPSTSRREKDKRSRRSGSSSASGARAIVLAQGGKIVHAIEFLIRSVIKMAPRTSHGWGLLVLSVLMMVYAVDFFFVLNSSSTSLHTDAPAKKVIASQVEADALTQELIQKGGGDGSAGGSAGSSSYAGMFSSDSDKKDTKGVAANAGAAGGGGGGGGGSGGQSEPLESRQATPSSAAAPLPPGPPAGADAHLHAASVPSSEPAPLLRVKDMLDAVYDSSRHPLNRQRTDLQVPGDAGPLPRVEVKQYYERLVDAYLEPYRREGISRRMFFDILKRKTYSMTPAGANKGVVCIFVQIIDGRVYVLDPHKAIETAKSFVQSRIRQVLWLISHLVAKGNVENTEFLLSSHDCVQTASAPHTYRGPTHIESSPVFTIVACNFSDNIPFPLWEGKDDRGGGFLTWDQEMEHFARDQIPWDQKKPQAVFRGGFRPSMYFQNKSHADLECDHVGRVRLVKLATENPTLLDASVGGTCGGQHYKLDRIAPEKQHEYRYVVYAEGNCFWADRLNRDLFGPSVVVKQETPCGQFYEPLLQPYGHYLPTDFFFTDLVDRIRESNAHDHSAQTRRIAQAANDFARNFLSLDGIELYVQTLLAKYTQLLKEKPTSSSIEKGAVDQTITARPQGKRVKRGVHVVICGKLWVSLNAQGDRRYPERLTWRVRVGPKANRTEWKPLHGVAMKVRQNNRIRHAAQR
ncbi:KDEL motif-containing protein 1 [Porphyridium purpureum]|uniref:KDEL motif-containing protein 1 n=1 Tax=Porphyridium purpureum TaxID=35688 RepID=A0A5J4YJL9_PORPP|nr:KDEL motif-containing protein 1 [Porphyridium purpureum]|eukprot:POR6494..scf261_15